MKLKFSSELVDQYLKGALSPEEELVFEKALEENETWRKIVKIKREMIQSGQPQAPEKEKWTISRLIELAFPVAFIGMAIFFYFQHNVFTGKSDEELFADWHSTYPMKRPWDPDTERAIRILMEEACRSYEEGRYDRSALQFEEIAMRHQGESYPSFYAGLSFLECGEGERAQFWLHQVVHDTVPDAFMRYPDDPQPNGGSFWREEAEWYEALAYLKEGNLEKCDEMMEEMVQNDGDYAYRAGRFLREQER